MPYPNEVGYCDEADVLQLIPNNETWSKVDGTRIKSAIADTATEIDSLVGRFYATPVSGDSAALALLRLVNKELARAFLEETFYRSSKNTSKGQTGVNGWRAAAYELLDQVVPPRLPDGTQPQPLIRFLLAPLQVPSELPQFPAGSGADFNSDTDADLHPDQQPFFSRTGHTPYEGDIM